MGKRLRVFVAEGETGTPHTTWRSRLVHRIMRRGRKDYYHKLYFGEKNGDMIFMITTPDGEIVAQCEVVNPDLLEGLLENVKIAHAQAKLVNG